MSNKPYYYARVTAVTKNHQGRYVVNVERCTPKEGPVKKGTVVQIDIGVFEATRHFGSNLTKLFVSDGIFVNENAPLAAALRWVTMANLVRGNIKEIYSRKQ